MRLPSQKSLDLVIRILTFLCLMIFFVKADLQPMEIENDDVVLKGEIKEDRLKSTTTPEPTSTSNLGFIHAFIASFSVIIVSEIGDKTFFIACIMAMKYPRLAVFGGAIAALALMTMLSAAFGTLFIKFIKPAITRWVSVGLFVVFGLKMLHEAYNMTATDAAEEMESVQSDLRKREEELNRERNSQVDAETGGARKSKSAFMFLFRIFMQAFTMTFVAEWGDRSQITTIVLAAREHIWGVIIGGTIGHAICTGLGVVGGRIIAQKISVRTVTFIGGVVFLIFAITSSIWDPTSDTSSLKESN